MIIYEITTTVDKELIKKYEEYMQEIHIPDLLETEYFESAEFAPLGEGKYRVSYAAKDREVLDRYLDTSAEALRKDFLRHFPAGVEVSREIYDDDQIRN